MPYTCPNKAWSGCTHSEHVFKYKKSCDKHAAKCEMARKQSESEEMDLRPLVKQLVKRLNELEQTVEVLKEDNRSLRQLMRSATVRAPYEVRGEGETPTHGFGEWGQDFFIQNVKATDDFYKKHVNTTIISRSMEEFICAVFYVANGCTKVVRIDPDVLKDRHGYPVRVDLNYRKRRRTVTLDAAVKQLFENPFLPTLAEIEDVLGRKVTIAITEGFKFYNYYLSMKPSKKHKSFGSWKMKVDLLLALANYTVPDRIENAKTREERQDEMYTCEVESQGRWWLQPRTWSMQQIVDTYDDVFQCSALYKAALRAYFEERPDRRSEYLEAGGELV